MWCGGSCCLHGLGELGGGEGECFELTVHGWSLRGWGLNGNAKLRRYLRCGKSSALNRVLMHYNAGLTLLGVSLSSPMRTIKDEHAGEDGRKLMIGVKADI